MTTTTAIRTLKSLVARRLGSYLKVERLVARVHLWGLRIHLGRLAKKIILTLIVIQIVIVIVTVIRQ